MATPPAGSFKMASSERKTPAEWAKLRTGEKLWIIYDELGALKRDSHEPATCQGFKDHLKGHSDQKKEFKKDAIIIIGWASTIALFVLDKWFI